MKRFARLLLRNQSHPFWPSSWIGYESPLSYKREYALQTAMSSGAGRKETPFLLIRKDVQALAEGRIPHGVTTVVDSADTKHYTVHKSGGTPGRNYDLFAF